MPRGRRLLVVLAVLGAAAGAAPSTRAQTTIGSGLLTGIVSDVTLPGATLNGTNQTSSGQPSVTWEIHDDRTVLGGVWTISASASGNLTSAAGSVETTPRTIAIGNLTFSAGTLTPGVLAGPTTNVSAPVVALSASSQTILSCSGGCTGAYTYSPTFTLTIPANAYRSNYSAAVGSSSLNPYTVTITYTIV